MKNLLACLTFAALSNLAIAETKPFNLSLTPDVALQNRTDSIHGLTLSIWGENQQKSLAIGIVNGSNGKSSGLSIGLINYVKGDFKGWQDGLINTVSGDFTGWQDGYLNYTGGEMRGLQTAWVNYAGKLRGVQIGLVNFAKTVEAGVQIGILNFIPQNEVWFTNMPDSVAPGMILVNWRF